MPRIICIIEPTFFSRQNNNKLQAIYSHTTIIMHNVGSSCNAESIKSMKSFIDHVHVKIRVSQYDK